MTEPQNGAPRGKGIHQVKVVDGVALKFPVVAEVGDLLTAGAGVWFGVWTLAIGQLLHG
jgi:hypothetical protein